MKRIAWTLAGLVAAVAVVAGAGLFYLQRQASATLSRTFDAHRVDFPIPYPLDEAEVARLVAERVAAGIPEAEARQGLDLRRLARERAVARGQHLMDAFYGCKECHGRDLGGGSMVEDPAIGRWYGVNLTAGKGGQVSRYTPADWDRIVRHGIKPDGRPTVMPSIDHLRMSDRELSDLIAYVQSLPPVDRDLPRPTLGPVGTMLVATGQVVLSADRIDHHAPHARLPPPERPDAEFGRHLGQVCVGCHGQSLSGGPIVGGPPDWPPAANLTPHPDGMKDWKYEEFLAAMKEGKGRKGIPLRAPMASITSFARNWTETETRALWAFLSTLPPAPTGK